MMDAPKHLANVEIGIDILCTTGLVRREISSLGQPKLVWILGLRYQASRADTSESSDFFDQKLSPYVVSLVGAYIVVRRRG